MNWASHNEEGECQGGYSVQLYQVLDGHNCQMTQDEIDNKLDRWDSEGVAHKNRVLIHTLWLYIEGIYCTTITNLRILRNWLVKEG